MSIAMLTPHMAISKFMFAAISPDRRIGPVFRKIEAG
jgi:hypothetical protein